MPRLPRGQGEHCRRSSAPPGPRRAAATRAGGRRAGVRHHHQLNVRSSARFPNLAHSKAASKLILRVALLATGTSWQKGALAKGQADPRGHFGVELQAQSCFLLLGVEYFTYLSSLLFKPFTPLCHGMPQEAWG